MMRWRPQVSRRRPTNSPVSAFPNSGFVARSWTLRRVAFSSFSEMSSKSSFRERGANSTVATALSPLLQHLYRIRKGYRAACLHVFLAAANGVFRALIQRQFQRLNVHRQVFHLLQ